MIATLRRSCLPLGLWLLLNAAPRAGEDLASHYPATMTWSQTGLGWECGPDDVWELSSFEVGQGRGLQIQGKKATVVFGRHETNVLWAVVLPDRPVKVRAKGPGDGEKTDAVLLRFGPSEVARIFPPKTVRGRGEPWRRARAIRTFRHKLGWKWYTPAGNPTIVPADFLIVDADTDAGARRFWGLNRTSGAVDYVADFESSPVPPAEAVTRREARAALTEVWEAFDREYATFGLLPELDWDEQRKRYLEVAGDVRDELDLAAVIAELLSHLEDLHVWVRLGDDWMPGYTRPRPLNASWSATQTAVGGVEQRGRNVYWGRTADGIGYVNVDGLSDPDLPEHVDAALEELADTWALVLDLRFNGGGDELLARAVAGRFLDEARVYSSNRYRSGPGRDDLGPVQDRVCEPRGPWRYAAPVVCLQGRRTMSSAESFALMMAQCPQVTTMGDPTAGSSGNPRRLELDCGIVCNLPRWLDMDPDGNPIERVGVAPDEAVEGDGFTADSDPVVEAALARLRAIPTDERAAARAAAGAPR